MSNASSGRARARLLRLGAHLEGALGGSTLPGGETGRPASASVARAYRLQSRRFHRRWLCRHKTTGKFFQHDETRSRRLLLHKAPNSSRSLSPSPRPSLSPSPRTNPTKPDPSSSPHPEPHPKPHQAPCASPSTLSLTKAEIRKLGAECDKKGLTIVPPSGLSTVPSWQCHSVLPWLRGAFAMGR